MKKPDPDRIPQGDQPAEAEHIKARQDVAQGAEQDRAAEPERERPDRVAQRGLDVRPSIQP